MGWSIDVVKKELDEIFRKGVFPHYKEIRYDVTHPEAYSPRVYVRYEGEITASAKRKVVELFPESVYVDFFPNSHFAGG